MKKLVVVLAVLGMAFSVFASDDPNYTDNLLLWKPDGDDRTAALADANDNWETLDNIFSAEQDITNLSIAGNITATGTAALGGGIHTRPLVINRARTAVSLNGDSSDTGAHIRISNNADQPTGYWVRGLDVEAYNDASGEASNVQGGNITGHAKIGQGNDSVANLYGLKVEAKANSGVSTSMVGQVIRMFRQAAQEPTTEVGLDIQCANTTGTGIDAGLRIESTGSGETDDFVNGIDLDSADIDQAEIVFSNGSKLFVGAQTTENGVYGEVGTYDAVGSVYFATNGKIFVQVDDSGDTGDWEIVTSASAE